MKKNLARFLCSFLALLLCCNVFIEPALAAGALGFSAYIPASLEIVIDENGAVHVPTGDAAKIFNNVKTKDICVTDISVTAKNDWFPANWIAGFDTMADNARFFGLRMRGDTMQADGSFSLTPDSWVIKSNSSIDLGIEVRLPAQTAARQEVIGEISFTLDWAKGSNPDDGKHTISFVPGKHGIVDDTTPVKTDEDGIILELPNVTPDDGYEFDHWEDQNGNPVKSGDKLDDDTTLKPVFSKDGSHSIGFIPGNHGTIDDDTPVRTDKDGTVPELPAVIPDDGYVFDHWEDQDGNPVEPGDTLDDDATLKPVFREDGSQPEDNSHTIDFVPGEHGTIGDDSPIKTDPDGVVPELPTVTPDDGYAFDHWEDQNGNPVKSGDKLDDDATLKPVFKEDGSQPEDNSHTIDFAPGEHGTIDNDSPTKTDPDGVVPELPTVTPDDGYEFDHWEDQNGNPVKPGDTLDDDTTLKPVFKEDGSQPEDNSHTVDFVPGEHGTVDDNSPIKTDQDGVVPELPTVTPDDGYEFDHWEDQNGNPVKPGDKLDDDATLKPVFRGDGSHAIDFAPGEHGTIDDDSPIKTDKNGVVPELPAVSPDDGYEFDHWEDQNGNPVKPGDKLDDDATLKPVLREDGSHAIDFAPGEHGTIDDDSPIRTNKDGVVTELPTATPDDGYEFDHWEDQNGNPVKPGDKLNDDVTLKPAFKFVGYLINFIESSHGSISNNQSIRTSPTGVVPALPSATPENGFKFSHWEDGFGNTVAEGNILNHSVTLHAVFIERAEVTITFLKGEKSTISGTTSVKVEKGTKWVDVPKPTVAPTNRNNQFLGWFSDANRLILDDYEVTYDMNASAKSGVWFEYDLASDGTAYVYGFSDDFENLEVKPSHIEFPSRLNSYPIEVISNSTAWRNRTWIKSIYIPDSVVDVDARAFSGCSNLAEVRLSPNLPYITSSCFEGTALTEFIAPPKCTEIGVAAFKNCTKLKKVVITSGMNRIKDEAFMNTAIKEISIPLSVSKIGNNAFAGCDGIHITINRPTNGVSGAPWGATNATIDWIGQ